MGKQQKKSKNPDDKILNGGIYPCRTEEERS
jgi:hypothetical protein